MTTTTPVTLADLELHADQYTPRHPRQAAAIYKAHGCLIVRGLMKRYAAAIRRDIAYCVEKAIANLDKAVACPAGWQTPDGTLFIPAPKSFKRDKQVMVTSCRYQTSGTFFRSALDEQLLDIVEQIIGPDIELFGIGQCLNKEPAGGHPKNLHQDAAYFEHKFEGPVAVLNYAVDTNLNNGCLHVVPGSHKLNVLEHIDTESHLGLDLNDWPWQRALPIEGKPGDAIFFHVKCIHGSKPNHSDGPRPVFIHRYRHPDDYTTVHASDAASRRDAEKRQAQATKDNQQGFMARGRRK